MTERSPRTLLWVDDEGPRRFVLELRHLERAGWVVAWARTIQEAIEALESREFRAVLLDQMLPMGNLLTDATNVWQGCLLLYWLRGYPIPRHAPAIEEWEAFAGRAPLDTNRRVRVIIVSAFFDAEVDAAMRAIEPDLSSIAKPLNAAALVKELNSSLEK